MRLLFIITILINFCIISSHAQIKKVYPFKSDKVGYNGTEQKDSSFFFNTSFSLDVFLLESATRTYKVGAIPGVGYGVRWNPKFNPFKTNSLLSFDLFTQANLTEESDINSGFDFFNIDVIPVLTILDWVGIGFGPRFKIGLGEEESKFTSVLSFGIRKTF